MKYLSLDLVDTLANPYPMILNDVKITIRGTKNLFNIFFKMSDVEDSFRIRIHPSADFTWINVGNKDEKYITYPVLKRTLINHNHYLVQSYLQWVDGLLFSTKVKPFYKESFSSNESTLDAFSDIDDNSSTHSNSHSESDREYMITSLEFKIQKLENTIQLQDRDITILIKELQLENKENELLRLQLAITTKSEWI